MPPGIRTDIEPLLIKHFSISHQTVLVPLCGKSKDMLWLRDKGHTVIGVELSSIACESFFEENNLRFKKSGQKSFQIFEAENLKIFCGDLFELDTPDLIKVTRIYDRAALIALPIDLRTRYIEWNKILLRNASFRNEFEILLITREEEGCTQGPPFSITNNDVQRFYADAFEIKTLEKVQRPKLSPFNVPIFETAYRLSGK